MIKNGKMTIPGYLVEALKRAAKAAKQTPLEYVDDLGIALLLGDTERLFID